LGLLTDLASILSSANRKIEEEGAVHIDDHFLPENVMEIQRPIGADIYYGF
jgi:hypothetical protein